jgi:hypothetical protein
MPKTAGIQEKKLEHIAFGIHPGQTRNRKDNNVLSSWTNCTISVLSQKTSNG